VFVGTLGERAEVLGEGLDFGDARRVAEDLIRRLAARHLVKPERRMAQAAELEEEWGLLNGLGIVYQRDLRAGEAVI
jgi:hypothetical protein